MDVVIFQRRNSDGANNDENNIKKQSLELELGAFQENGSIAPLSTWSLESAYTSGLNDMMEFLVDEEDLLPGLTPDDIEVLQVLDGSVVGYGSRQVGGGKGPGNPHGEESELLYYVDRSVVEGEYEVEGESAEVNVVVNPALELLW